MDHKSATVAVVGVGGLGGALARGLLANGLSGGRLVLCDVQFEKMAAVAGPSGARTVSEPSEAARSADVVVVCVKPPDVAQALDRISSQVKPHTVVLSAAAGVTLVKLREALGAHGMLARVMPNVNVAVGQSITTLCAEPGESPEALLAAEWVFSTVGRTVRLPDEKMMDAATALGASGPAWMALVMEALMDGGVQAGLPRGVAVELALGMVEGTARHLKQLGLHPGALKDMVTSPGGTTAAGQLVLETRAVRGALMAAVDAAAERAKSLTKG